MPLTSGVVGQTERIDARHKQLRYYRAIAESYDSMYHSQDEHYVALQLISAYIRMLNIKSVLDTGCGTGRGMRYLLDNHPGIFVAGNDVSEDLIDVAVRRNGIPRENIICASSDMLPFDDNHFDAVLELGVLHHVPHPETIVTEMVRVAKRAVFISDCNRFGHSRWPLRVVKAILYRAGLWGVANWLNNRGKVYSESAGDGIAYSYSVFDSIPTLTQRMSQIVTLPTKGDSIIGGISFFQASHLLVCGFEKRE
jgi:ubiquinone/menaquinone biosynthesis C-methylase UbiE